MTCKDKDCTDSSCMNSYHWNEWICCKISPFCTQPNGHNDDCT